MKLKLNDGICSRQDLKTAILEVRNYSQWLAHESVKQRFRHDGESRAPVLSEAAADLIKQWPGEEAPTQQSLEELITALEDLAVKAPGISFTLAAMAPSDLKKSLLNWCRQQINPTILVEFRFNRALLGGMVVRYGSHAYDWSFRRQILANIDRFPEVLRRHV